MPVPTPPPPPPDPYAPYRTPDVAALCLALLHARGDNPPARRRLHDALVTAGLAGAADPEQVLTHCAAAEPHLTELKRLVALVHGGAPAAAVRWLEEFGSEVLVGGHSEENDEPLGYHELVDGLTACATGDADEIRLGMNTEGYGSGSAEMWGHFTALTGLEPPDDFRDDGGTGFSPFSCAC